MENSGQIVWAIAREEVRLARGLRALTAIAYGAPMAGVLLTCFGIIGSFRGGSGSKEAWLGRTAQGLFEAIIPTAAGLLIGIFAITAQRYLRVQVDALVFEMIWYRATPAPAPASK